MVEGDGVDGRDGSPREQIVQFLEERPGATIRAVAKALGCTPQSASYHLDILARSGVVVSRTEGRNHRHFTTSHARDPHVFVLSLMRDPQRASILRILATSDRASWTINQLAQASGASFGVCKRVAVTLAENGMVSMERRRGSYLLRPTGVSGFPGIGELELPVMASRAQIPAFFSQPG